VSDRWFEQLPKTAAHAAGMVAAGIALRAASSAKRSSADQHRSGLGKLSHPPKEELIGYALGWVIAGIDLRQETQCGLTGSTVECLGQLPGVIWHSRLELSGEVARGGGVFIGPTRIGQDRAGGGLTYRPSPSCVLPHSEKNAIRDLEIIAGIGPPRSHGFPRSETVRPLG
jgi:hypothetical protein